MEPRKHIHHTNTSKQHNRPKRKHPNQHHTSTFTTPAPPTVTSITPTTGQTNIPTTQTITITFNNPITAGTAYNNIAVIRGSDEIQNHNQNHPRQPTHNNRQSRMGPLKHIHNTNTSKQHNRPKRKHPNQHLHINLQHISTTNRNKHNTNHRPNQHTKHPNNNNNLQQPHNSRNSIQQHSRNKKDPTGASKTITKTIQGNQLQDNCPN